MKCSLRVINKFSPNLINNRFDKLKVDRKSLKFYKKTEGTFYRFSQFTVPVHTRISDIKNILKVIAVIRYA